jgi:cell division protein FtsW
MVVLYSAGMNVPDAKFLHKQLIWGALGVVACVIASLIDYQFWKKLAIPALAIAFVLLILVLVPKLGIEVNGAQRWLGSKSFRFQPSEAAKVSLLLFLSFYADRNFNRMRSFVRGLVVPASVCSVLAGLIFLEPDAGTTILCLTLTGTLLFLAGTRLVYLLPPLIVVCVAFGLFLKYDPVRSKRIYAWLHPEETRLGIGLQSYQAKLALGSGGIAGVGLGEGRQKLGFVPEHQTDFIFSVIGEEMGFIATVGVILAFVGFAISGAMISWQARDVFGYLLGSGITLLISFQALINIGVVTSVLPNKGLSLPFISYGGSNLLIVLFLVGILFSVARVSGLSKRSRNDNPFSSGEEVHA